MTEFASVRWTLPSHTHTLKGSSSLFAVQELLGMWDVCPPASLSCPFPSKDSRQDNELHCIETSPPHPCCCSVPTPTADWAEKQVFSFHLPEPTLHKELPEMPWLCVCRWSSCLSDTNHWLRSWYDSERPTLELLSLLLCPLLPFFQSFTQLSI